MPNKRDDTAVTAAARNVVVGEAVDEYRRLLYVALTRAADRLIICGSVGVRKQPDGCWYDLICDALTPYCIEEPADVGEGTLLRYRKCEPERPRRCRLIGVRKRRSLATFRTGCAAIHPRRRRRLRRSRPRRPMTSRRRGRASSARRARPRSHAASRASAAAIAARGRARAARGGGAALPCAQERISRPRIATSSPAKRCW